MLVPKDHMFGSKRLPCESGYYEVFNQDNVLLVDVREAPIERITPNGLKTAAAEYELDVIIFATGYDAVTGALNKIEIRGEGGQTLKDKFAGGPRTYMGISSAGFPNLFTVNSASVGNFVRACEPLVEWVTQAICYVRDNEYTRISATPEAEEAWVNHVNEAGAKILRTQANSWFVGANIPGKARVLLTAPDTAPAMRAKRAAVAANGYEAFIQIMKVAVFGLGYVGVVTAAGLASKGHRVIGVDIQSGKVDVINEGRSPIHEDGLDKLVHDSVNAGTLTATTDAHEAVTQSEISFIARPGSSPGCR